MPRRRPDGDEHEWLEVSLTPNALYQPWKDHWHFYLASNIQQYIEDAALYTQFGCRMNTFKSVERNLTILLEDGIGGTRRSTDVASRTSH